jgi:hypothetical protein
MKFPRTFNKIDIHVNICFHKVSKFIHMAGMFF